jgi:hypothetical protein
VFLRVWGLVSLVPPAFPYRLLSLFVLFEPCGHLGHGIRRSGKACATPSFSVLVAQGEFLCCIRAAKKSPLLPPAPNSRVLLSTHCSLLCPLTVLYLRTLVELSLLHFFRLLTYITVGYLEGGIEEAACNLRCTKWGTSSPALGPSSFSLWIWMAMYLHIRFLKWPPSPNNLRR